MLQLASGSPFEDWGVQVVLDVQPFVSDRTMLQWNWKKSDLRTVLTLTTIAVSLQSHDQNGALGNRHRFTMVAASWDPLIPLRDQQAGSIRLMTT